MKVTTRLTLLCSTLAVALAVAVSSCENRDRSIGMNGPPGTGGGNGGAMAGTGGHPGTGGNGGAMAGTGGHSGTGGNVDAGTGTGGELDGGACRLEGEGCVAPQRCCGPLICAGICTRGVVDDAGGDATSGTGGHSGTGGAPDAAPDSQTPPSDAGPSCPASVPRSGPPNFTPFECTTLDYLLRCTYHSGETGADGPSTCDQTFACQCTGGGPSAQCFWMNTSFQTCP
jgi:hypothetical protein